jgi:hypothetical protein
MPGEDSWYVVDALRVSQPHLVPTFLAALAVTGAELAPSWRAEIEECRQRGRALAGIEEQVRQLAANARTVKGSAVSARYPAGLVRFQSDIDVVLDSTAEVLALGRKLETLGWQPMSLTAFSAGGQRQLLLNLWHAGADSGRPFHLDIASAELVGDLLGVPARGATSTNEDVRALVAAVAGRLQRPFHLRDVLDAALLLAALDAPARQEVSELLGQLGLRPEAAELQRLLTRWAAWAPALPAAAGRGARRPWQRDLAAVLGMRGPARQRLARLCQHELVYGSRTKLAGRCLGLLTGDLGASQAAENGLLTWGVRLDEGVQVPARWRAEVQDGPLGAWLMVPTPVVPDWAADLIASATETADDDSNANSSESWGDRPDAAPVEQAPRTDAVMEHR